MPLARRTTGGAPIAVADGGPGCFAHDDDVGAGGSTEDRHRVEPLPIHGEIQQILSRQGRPPRPLSERDPDRTHTVARAVDDLGADQPEISSSTSHNPPRTVRKRANQARRRSSSSGVKNLRREPSAIAPTSVADASTSAAPPDSASRARRAPANRSSVTTCCPSIHRF